MALRFSTKGRYGIRAMCCLARLYEKGPISIRTIVRQEKIPVRYLEQIMVRLRREGVLESTRGPGGGYRLKRPPDQITLGEIIRILEGNVSVVWCAGEDRETPCSHEDNCVPRSFWLKLNREIQSLLNNTTLQALIDQNRENRAFTSLVKESETDRGQR